MTVYSKRVPFIWETRIYGLTPTACTWLEKTRFPSLGTFQKISLTQLWTKSTKIVCFTSSRRNSGLSTGLLCKNKFTTSLEWFSRIWLTLFTGLWDASISEICKTSCSALLMKATGKTEQVDHCVWPVTQLTHSSLMSILSTIRKRRRITQVRLFRWLWCWLETEHLAPLTQLTF